MADALSTSDLSAGYGETVVLEDINLTIGEGQCLSILGRNGVGKSTLLETLMGHTNMHAGSVSLLGSDITSMPVHRRVAAGLGYVPQEREIFPSLTVAENLEVAARPGDWQVERVYDFFPNLAERRTNRGNQLSGGEQQMLAIGRALMGNPKVLLMDEPSEGLAPVVVEELQKGMTRLRDEAGLTIILVEQNSRLAMGFAPRSVVMSRGRVMFDGESAALAADEELLTSLLGVEGSA
ncbi:MAG: ABC transporter ATP-binding protein [Hyphomicrobiales bacterium]